MEVSEQDRREAEDLFINARNLITTGHYNEAEAECCKGIRRVPNSAEGWQILGSIYKSQNKVQDSILAFRRSLGYATDQYVQSSLAEIAQEQFKQLQEQTLICSAILQTWLEQHNKYTVTLGPFAGMKIHPDSLLTGQLGQGALAKVIGTYAIELQPWLESLRTYRKIIVANAGEGYFAIGLKRLYVSSQVIAVDPSAEFRRSCTANAAINGVSIDIVDSIPTISEPEDTFLFLDVEGDEDSFYIDCDAIVEVHDWVDRSLPDRLVKQYKLTHKVDILMSGSRDPNKIEFLTGFPDSVRWLAAQDQRPESMMWLRLIKE
jgi:tetratricopeptide (TPR) repeat protein